MAWVLFVGFILLILIRVPITMAIGVSVLAALLTAGFAHPLDQKESTVDRHARILVDVHPRLLGQLFRSCNHSFNPKPRMNNLHSSHS